MSCDSLLDFIYDKLIEERDFVSLYCLIEAEDKSLEKMITANLHYHSTRLYVKHDALYVYYQDCRSVRSVALRNLSLELAPEIRKTSNMLTRFFSFNMRSIKKYYIESLKKVRTSMKKSIRKYNENSNIEDALNKALCYRLEVLHNSRILFWHYKNFSNNYCRVLKHFKLRFDMLNI